MDLTVNIDSEAAQQQVVQAILDSAIGDLIQTEINNLLNEKTGGYYGDRIIEAAVKKHINDVVAKIVREIIDAKQEEIKAIVTPMISEEVIKEMSSAAIEVMLGRLERR